MPDTNTLAYFRPERRRKQVLFRRRQLAVAVVVATAPDGEVSILNKLFSVVTDAAKIANPSLKFARS